MRLADVANDGALLEVRKENVGTFMGGHHAVIEYQPAGQATPTQEDERYTTKEDDTMEVDMLRGDGGLGPNEARVQVTTGGTSMEQTEEWSDDDYKVSFALGNRGQSFAQGAASVRLEKLIDASGGIPLLSMALCTAYGEATEAPTPVPTPPTTMRPTPAPTLAAVSNGKMGCPARCPALERIKCMGNDMQPLSPGKDMCDCDKPQECVFIKLPGEGDATRMRASIAAALFAGAALLAWA